MTVHQCQECGGEGGWTLDDGTKQNCPECSGWGDVDDGVVTDYYNDDPDDDVARPSNAIQYGY